MVVCENLFMIQLEFSVQRMTKFFVIDNDYKTICGPVRTLCSF